MKKLVTLFFLFVLSIFSVGFSQKYNRESYPNYKDVVEHFFNSNSNDNYKEIRFIKTLKGFSALVPDGYGGLDTVGIWSKIYNGYISKSDNEKQLISHNTKARESCKFHFVGEFWKHYNLHPFYGYPGYNLDIINYYKDKIDLNADDYYSLGRAYDHLSSNLLNINKNNQVDSLKFDLPFGYNSMNKDQLEQYCHSQEMTTSCFQKVYDINPKYKTIVGNIETKLSNSWVDYYLHLLQFQNKEEAQKVVKTGLYSESILSTARNYLNSCEKNSILISYGDNDYFPLKYLQYAEGFREDVAIMHVNLLYYKRYVNHCLEESKENKIVVSNYTYQVLKDEFLPNFVYTNKDTNVRVSDIIPLLMDSNKILNKKKYPTIGKSFTLEKIEGLKGVKLSSSKYYLSFFDLFFMDVLNENYRTKKIYFTTKYVVTNLNLSENLSRMGQVFLVDFSENKKDYDIDKAYQFYTQYFDWSGFNTINQENSRTFYSLRNNLSSLAFELISKNLMDSVSTIVNLSLEKIPNHHCYFDAQAIHIADILFKLKRNEEANEVVNKLTENIINTDLFTFYLNPFSEENSELKDLINHLTYLENEYKSVGLTQNLDKLKNYQSKTK